MFAIIATLKRNYKKYRSIPQGVQKLIIGHCRVIDGGEETNRKE